MSQTDVLIVIERAARELDVACAVRHLARRRHGLRVDVVSLRHASESALRRVRPRVVAVPHFYATDAWAEREVLRRFPMATFVNLAYEHILYPMSRRGKRPRDAIARERVITAAAGDLHRRHLAEFGVVPEVVEPVGSLACSLYLEPYRRHFEGMRGQLAREHGLDPDRRWCFFPENYGAAFFGPGRVETRVREGYDRASFVAWCEHSRAALRAVMPWCWEAAEAGNVELIVRPRPTSPAQRFTEECERSAGRPRPSRLHFIERGTVREWILASDIVISGQSTSLVEAAVAGKPTRILEPVAYPDFLRYDWFHCLPHLKSADELRRLLEGPITEPSGGLQDWADEHLLAYGDAIGNLTDLLAAVRGGRRPAPLLGEVPRCEKRPMPRRRWAWPGWLPGGPGNSGGEAFSAHEVRRRTRRWGSVLGLPQGP